MSDDEPKSIRALFLTAERLRNQISNAYDSSTPTYQENLSAAIATYESCLTLSEQVSLFSPNESLDDISSSDLQYMSIAYQLADLVQKIRSTDIAERKENLLKAREYYERFYKLLDVYDILSKSDTKLWESYLEDKAQFSTASTRDAAARRETKIARFREEKELKKKIDYIHANPKLAENDEQLVRSLHLTNLTFQSHQGFAALESLAQELHIISLAPPPQPANPSSSTPSDAREGSRGDAYSERLDTSLGGLGNYSGPILSSSGKPLRPFTLTDNRAQLRKNVFRPDHNLPTMSIDDYLEEEKKRGGIIEGGGEQSGIRPEVDEDDFDKADEETMKARAWDEYVEENPKGSGNTLNRG
ncbi:type 2A phosphatase-associated protein 42 [Massarina eburnea CBS 473.64]|uniref:Type 2A phosphatase-associated protein 42 n=1 Tax=Massarina eburnea CBS 473.64 TaxID=1395130 RepID=A0A6A6SEX1_9PLEO|nr:type 2A phosphatase-associated protein 42 [Massarina eburnea CBS 473.64]